MEILDAYVLKKPSNQNVIDIFNGEWSSRMPENSNCIVEPGIAGLFEDGRVLWAEEKLGGFYDANILELGPLEGGHSYMLNERKCKQVTAIEANTRAYLKCLCIKEIFALNKVSFLLGDFIPYLEDNTAMFDIVFASGVLYHMENPIRLLDLISRATDKVFLWTHYYDSTYILNNMDLRIKFSPIQQGKYDDLTYEYSTQSYLDSLNWAGFCGGPKATSKWLTKDSIIKALHEFGFSDLYYGFEQPKHQNGPALGICAKKARNK